MSEFIRKIKPTITTIFMVPTMKINSEDMTNNEFLNGYIKEKIENNEYEDCIYILFKPSNLDMFRAFIEKEYERTKQIITDYDIPGGFVIVVYKLDKDFKEDFDLVRKGKYSKTSDKFKNLFPKIKRIIINGLYRDELSLQTRIFKKTTDLKEFWETEFNMTFDEEQEVWHGFIEENETLTKEKLKEYE